MSDLPDITIYTDGSCDPNPGPGGWAAILMHNDKEKIVCGHEQNTTNNRMEILAAIKALQSLNIACNVIIYTDSKYLLNGATQWYKTWIRNGWRKSSGGAVKNSDLWRLLIEECARHSVQWRWVPSHAYSVKNNRVDQIAVTVRHSPSMVKHYV